MLEQFLKSDAQVLLSTATDTGVELEASWQGKVARARFSYAWLRDHCHSKESLNPDTCSARWTPSRFPRTLLPPNSRSADGGRTSASSGSTTEHQHSAAAFLWTLPKTTAGAAPRRQLWIARRWEKNSDHEPCGHHVERRRIAALAVAGEEYGFAWRRESRTNEATKELVTRIGYVANRSSAACGISGQYGVQDTAYTSARSDRYGRQYSIDPPATDVPLSEVTAAAAEHLGRRFQDCRRDPPLDQSPSTCCRRSGSGALFWRRRYLRGEHP